MSINMQIIMYMRRIIINYIGNKLNLREYASGNSFFIHWLRHQFNSDAPQGPELSVSVLLSGMEKLLPIWIMILQWRETVSRLIIMITCECPPPPHVWFSSQAKLFLGQLLHTNVPPGMILWQSESLSRWIILSFFQCMWNKLFEFRVIIIMFVSIEIKCVCTVGTLPGILIRERISIFFATEFNLVKHWNLLHRVQH